MSPPEGRSAYGGFLATLGFIAIPLAATQEGQQCYQPVRELRRSRVRLHRQGGIQDRRLAEGRYFNGLTLHRSLHKIVLFLR